MPYRESPTPTPEPPDVELVAIQRLHRRISVVTMLVTIPIVLGGLVLAVVAYGALRDFQLARSGAHVIWVTVTLSVGPTFGPALWFAPNAAKRVVRLLLPGWRRALAEEHGLDVPLFEETTRFLG